jgi:solute carrier family 25 carnitine/acylcarnitine transporter 20/29
MSRDYEGVTRAVKDITAGSIGGIAQVLTGQPFDIVKVHDTPKEHPPFLSFGKVDVYSGN